MYPDPMYQPIPPADDRRTSPPLSEDTSSGTLVISAGYGNRAFPLPGVRAEIYVPAEPSGEETPSEVLFAVRETDASGIAPPLTVPAPDASYSEAPGSLFLPFTVLRVRVFRDGFAPQEATQVPVFAGIRSLQYFEMVPTPEAERYGAPSGLFTTVSESADNAL